VRSWTIKWGDTTWTDEQATAGHVIAVADILEAGVGFDVSPWDGPKQLAAWIAVLLSTQRVNADNVADVEQLLADALSEVYVAKPDALLDALLPRWSAPSADDLVFEDDFDSVGV